MLPTSESIYRQKSLKLHTSYLRKSVSRMFRKNCGNQYGHDPPDHLEKLRQITITQNHIEFCHVLLQTENSTSVLSLRLLEPEN
jgi:hypothetical protein